MDEYTRTLDRSNLSQMQLFIWAGQKLNESNPLHNTLIAQDIYEPVDLLVMQKAFQAVIDRRDSLRTIIVEEDGIPQQKVFNILEYKAPYYDFSHDQNPRQAAEEWIQEQARIAFKMDERLFSAALLKICEQEFIWFINQHHIITDGWTQNLLWKDLSENYRKIICNKSLDTSAKVAYQEYINFEKSFRNSPRYKLARSYWNNILGLHDEPLRISGQLPAHKSTKVQRISRKLGAALTKKLLQGISSLNASRQSAESTKFQLFLALYAILLFRISGQKVVYIGVPIHNRRTKKFKDVTGLIMHVVPVRIEINENDSVITLRKHVAQSMLKAMQHGHYVISSSLHKPVYDALMNYHLWGEYNVFHQKKVNHSWIHPGHNQESLSLHIHYFEAIESLKDTNLRVDIDFNEDVFDADLRERVSEYFFNIIASALEDINQPVSQIRILSDKEIHQQTVEFNNTNRDYSLHLCLHELIEKQVEKTPAAIAVIFENKQLSYKDLNTKANHLAVHLKSLGISQQDLVGVCMDRSFDMIIGLLGILKAGAVYVPLDPTYPQQRLACMMEDANIHVLITQEHLYKLLPKSCVKIIKLSDENLENQETAIPSSSSWISSTNSANLAYVIYTSGSTGKPKGAMNTHQAIVNRLLWMQEEYQLTPEDCVLHKTPFSFDVSVWEFFWPLITGARMVIAKPEGHKDPNYIRDLIIEQGITTIHFVPSMLKLFLMSEKLEKIRSLKNVICSGEALSVDLNNQFFKKINASLHNLYGPTEAAIDVTYWCCERECTRKIVPIGRPIANTQIYILDEFQHPVPFGTPGELYIGGIGVGRGYLNQPELTKEKFLPNPFSKDSNSRLYKTGDLARFISDGNIEFLGRIDHQVKIHGFRIELGEIEEALMQDHRVSNAVVVAREGQNDNKQLVAYVVIQDEDMSNDQLRSLLMESLPNYMIPAVFVKLESLPLTANGKLDRKALPEPKSIMPSEEQIEAAPRNEVEDKLVKIWSDILGYKEGTIGINDNFYELGGDSIIGIQIISRASQLGIVVKPMQLFENQTISELAQVVKVQAVTTFEQGLVTGPLPLTPIQERFFNETNTEPHHFNQSLIFEVPADINIELLEKTLNYLIHHHDGLRLEFNYINKEWQQFNALPKDNLSLEIIDLFEVSGERKKDTFEEKVKQLQSGFSLSEGPLMKAALFFFNKNTPGQLMIILHHLIVDGVSWRILMEDLQTVYRQLNSGNEIMLQQKTSSFKEWAIHLRYFAESEKMKSEWMYWLAEVRGSNGKLPIDYVFKEELNIHENTEIIRVTLNKEKTKRLLQQIPQVYNTQVNEMLVTALVQTMAGWMNEQSILINLEGHGREDLFPEIDVTRTVGWFTSIFPVRFELKAGMPISMAIKTVKEKLRGIPHQGIGYGILKYGYAENKYVKILQEAPEAEILFNYLGQMEPLKRESDLFRSVKVVQTASYSLKRIRSHLLEINALVTEGQLEINWYFNRKIHQVETIEWIANNYLKFLDAQITHCQLWEAGGYTPSDFPEINLNQKELDELIAQI